MNTIDMHMHSTASDGSDTIPELLKKLQDSGITTFSVTDHDTIDGALEMEHLVPPSMRYVRGVEFSCITPHGKCHILGYGYDPFSPAFQAVLDDGRSLREKKLTSRLAAMEDRFGIHMTQAEMDWLLAQKSPGKPHIAQILVDRGLYSDIRAAISQAVNLCGAPDSRLEAEQVIPAILRAGGIPVWAHPLGGEGERLLSPGEFAAQLTYLTSIGLRGLECFYSRYEPAQIQTLLAQAERHSLLVSGGSDFHGKNKANISLGKLNAQDLPIPREQITLLSCLPPRRTMG